MKTMTYIDPSEQESIEKSIQKFVARLLHVVNFKAITYPDLIDWENATFTELPLTVNFSDHDLNDLIRNPLCIPFFTCQWSEQ